VEKEMSMSFKIMLVALAAFAVLCATIAYCVHDSYAHPPPPHERNMTDVERCGMACKGGGRAMESWSRAAGEQAPFACTCAKASPTKEP
jgi:hypothetical protein